MNSSQALKNLKQSAKKQTEELKNFSKEIHQENWNKLSSDLTAITNKKLNTIEQSFNRTMQDIQEQNKWRYSLITISATALIFLLIGVTLAEYTPRMSERIAWTVPEKMRYEEKGIKYIEIKSEQVLRKQNKEKTRYFIKIGSK